MVKLKNNIEIKESGFVFNPETGESYKANPIGIEVLQFLKDNKQYDEITEIIILKYDVTANMFERYYLDFIQTLRNEDFLNAY